MQQDYLPSTIAEARTIGSNYYFNKKPCKNGHISKRYVISRTCFECKKEKQIKSRADNPVLWMAYNKKANLSARRKKSKAEWREKNRDKINQQNREWHANNPEKAAAKIKKWRSKNQESCRTYSRNRKALIKNAAGKHTKDDVLAIYEKQNKKCPVCNACLLSGYHVDHIVPLSKGGSNDAKNLQLLCAPCNQSKSNKDFAEWLLQRITK